MNAGKRILSLLLLCVICVALLGVVAGFLHAKFLWVMTNEILLLVTLWCSYWLNSRSWNFDAGSESAVLSNSRETRVLPHWEKLIFFIGSSYIIGIGFAFLARSFWWDEEYVDAVTIAVIAIVALFAASNWLSFFGVLLRNGYLFRMTKKGVQYSGFSVIPWSSIDLLYVNTVAREKDKAKQLTIKLHDHKYQNSLPPLWIRWSSSLLLNFSDTGSRITIPLYLVKKSPESIESAAKRWMKKAQA